MSVINKLRTLLGGRPAESGIAWQMDRFIEILEPRIAALPGYRERLEPAAQHAHDYCTHLATGIPGPYPLSRTQHGSDPLLGALFPQREDIGIAMGRSIEVRERIHEFADIGDGEIHALLGMRQRTLAAPRTDNPQQPRGWRKPQFADHTLRSLGDCEDAVRQQFVAAAFDSLRHGFRNQVENLRRCKKLMHSERALQNESAAQTGSAAEDGGALDMLATDLSPASLLGGLIDWLNAPQQHLRLEMGHEDATLVMPLDDPGQRGLRKLELPALISADRRRWPLCLVRFTRAEALAAVGRENLAHRYILI